MRADTPIDSLNGRTVSTQRRGSAVTMSSTSNRDSSRTSSSAWSWPVSSSGRSLSSPFQSPRLPALAWRTSSTEPVIAGRSANRSSTSRSMPRVTLSRASSTVSHSSRSTSRLGLNAPLMARIAQ